MKSHIFLLIVKFAPGPVKQEQHASDRLGNPYQVNAATKINLLDLTRQDMEAFFAQLGEKAFRATQVLKWLHQYGVDHIQDMTNLSKSLRAQLEQLAEINAPKIVVDAQSEDGTRKYPF